MGTYVNLNDVNDFLNIEITESTKPNSDFVDTVILEVEAGMKKLALGSYAVTDKYLDVPGAPAKSEAYKWVYTAETDNLEIGMGGGSIILLDDILRPIVSITSLEKNDQLPQNAASWETLTEGPGTGSHYILLQSQELGYAIWVYDDLPKMGPKRLKLSYNYGHNVDAYILSEYARLKVCEAVLMSRMMAADPVGIRVNVGPSYGNFVNDRTQYLIEYIQTRCKLIESMYFPAMRATVEIV